MVGPMAKPTHASLPLLTEIPAGCSLQKSSEGQRFTCIREGDTVHVLADRCPHQGYPLSQGTVRDGVLTCAWHNWKFDAETGASQFGGEGVRRFPSEVVEGRVVVDLRIDEAAERERLRGSMTQALNHGDGEALIRDGLRLGELGSSSHGRVGPALAWLAKLAAERVPYGFGHPLATLADITSWIERGWLDDLTALALVATMFGQEHGYRPVRALPEPVEGFAGACEDLRNERRALAEAKARAGARSGALDALIRTEWLPFLGDHLYAYGHGAIYTTKIRRLHDCFPDASEDLAGALAVRLGWATAETALPPWKATREGYAAVDGLELGAGTLGEGRHAYEQAVLESERAAVDATVAAIGEGVGARALIQASAHAAAIRVARFDAAWEQRADAEVTLLDVSHCLTFAEAALGLLELASPREAKRLAVQAAAFVGKLHRGDRPASETAALQPLSSTLAEAIVRRDPSDVALADTMDAEARRAAYVELAPFAASGVFVRPIFIAHAIKMTEAAYQLELGDPDADHAYLAAALATTLPRRPERSPTRSATLTEQAVRDGRPPKGLY